MTYEEKRELRLQISQLLADAGLNQQTIKQMVEKEVNNKVNRAVDQVIQRLNENTFGGDYIETIIRSTLNSTYITKPLFSNAVKEELKNRVINVTLKNVEITNG